jgi:transketolase
MRQHALETVYNLAKKDPRIVFIGSDLGSGTLQEMKKNLPKQFFMEGIAEQHVVGFAAGLAKEGFFPYVNTIGTFLTRRAFEQISIDIGLHRLPVRLLSSGGGMVYAPLGPTHTSIEDFSLMLSVPNMKVFAPADAVEMENLINTLVYDPSPHFIRFGKGGESIVTDSFHQFDLQPKIFGKAKPELLILTTGIVLQNCLEVKSKLEAKNIFITVIHFPYLNHLAINKLKSYFSSAKVVLCIEEHVPRGGLFTQVIQDLFLARFSSEKLYHLSLPKDFSHKYGSQSEHLHLSGMSVERIIAFIEKLLGIRSK